MNGARRYNGNKFDRHLPFFFFASSTSVSAGKDASTGKDNSAATTSTAATPTPTAGNNNEYFNKAHSKSEAVRQPSSLKGGTLKEYQLQGLQWMVRRDSLEQGLAPSARLQGVGGGGGGGGMFLVVVMMVLVARVSFPVNLVRPSSSLPSVRMAGVSVQQQLERNPGRRDGLGQDHPDHRPPVLPDGGELGRRG